MISSSEGEGITGLFFMKTRLMKATMAPDDWGCWTARAVCANPHDIVLFLVVSSV
jgi:hypothetical protein